MDTIRMRKYQERLLKHRRQILSTVKRLDQQLREEHEQMNFDWADEVSDDNEIALIEELSDAHLAEVTKIDRALGRMLSGTYGLCIACHRSIEKWKLESVPEVEFCLHCRRARGVFKKAG
jgi:RNA polymerase-binding transcription factor DksA